MDIKDFKVGKYVKVYKFLSDRHCGELTQTKSSYRLHGPLNGSDNIFNGQAHIGH